MCKKGQEVTKEVQKENINEEEKCLLRTTSFIKDGHSHCYTRFIIASELQGADYRSIFKLCIDPTSSIYNKKKAVCPSFQEPTQLSYKMHKNHEPLKFSESFY